MIPEKYLLKYCVFIEKYFFFFAISGGFGSINEKKNQVAGGFGSGRSVEIFDQVFPGMSDIFGVSGN